MPGISFEEWLQEDRHNQEVTDYLIAEHENFGPDSKWANGFLTDLYRIVNAKQTLTHPQVMAAAANIERRQMAVIRMAESAGREHTPVPEGTHTFQGEVIGGPKPYRNPKSRGSVMKMMIDVGPYKVWGTCPAHLLYVRGEHGQRPLGSGDMVRLTAELKRSKEDSVGYFSSPKNGEYLGTRNANPARQAG
jgi:hypothetical protein